MSILTLALAAAAHALSTSDFIPYGSGQVNTGGDDGCSIFISAQGTYKFFGETASQSVQISRNGVISFGGCVGGFTPIAFPTTPFPSLSPYWADINFNEPGSDIQYAREATDEATLEAFTEKLEMAGVSGFDPTHVLVATYENARYFGASGDDKENTFQAAVGTDGSSTYAIFLYAQIEWTTGTASGGVGGVGGIPAQVGFDAGDFVNYFAIPESFTSDVINVPNLSNVDIPGMYVFEISEEEIIDVGAAGDPILVDFDGHRFVGGKKPNTNYLLYASETTGERIEFLTSFTDGHDDGYFMRAVSISRPGCGTVTLTAAAATYETLVDGPDCFTDFMAHGDKGVTSVAMANNGAIVLAEPHLGNGFSFLNIKLLAPTPAFKTACTGMLCGETHDDILA